jgi:hypothetical protein
MQQPPRSLLAGPDGTVQDAMLRLKKCHVRQTHDSQSSRDSPLAGGQHGPDQQDLDRKSGMHESLRTGLARHPDPRSGGGHSEVTAAWREASAGGALDRRTAAIGVPTRLDFSGRPHGRGRSRASVADPASSMPPGTLSHGLHENRETAEMSKAHPQHRLGGEGPQPYGRRARLRGVRPRDRRERPRAPRRPTVGGAGGGKCVDPGEHTPIPPAPDPARGVPVPGLGTCAPSRTRTAAGAVHRPPPPAHERSAAGPQRGVEAAGRAWGGWRDRAGV